MSSSTVAAAPDVDAPDVDALLALGRGGEVCRFVSQATSALADGLEHDELRLMLMRRLARYGLLAPAATLARGLSSAFQSNPEYDRLLTLGGTTGQVPWLKYRAQFLANLAALRVRNGWAGIVERAWTEEREQLELHIATGDVPLVFQRRSESSGVWRPSFGDLRPSQPAHALAKELEGKLIAPLVLEGVGLGFHLPWLYAATTKSFFDFSAVIYLIEPSWLALAVALHLNDWRKPLTDPRVRLCCGPTAYRTFERLLKAEEWNVLPVLPDSVTSEPAWDGVSPGRAEAAIRRVAALQASAVGRLRDELAARYSGRDAAWWHGRFAAACGGTGPPLRVLGITSRFTTVLQYSTRDALAALRACGCQTQLLIEPNAHSLISPQKKLATLLDFEPDLILLIDHTRRGQKLIEDVLVVTWIQDRLPWLFDCETGAALGPLDFVMGFSGGELVRDFGYPTERFLPCEMATDPSVFWPRDDDRCAAAATCRFEENDTHLACDVAFATNYNGAPDDFFASVRGRADPLTQRFLEACYDELRRLMARGELTGGLFIESFLLRMEKALDLALAPADRRKLEAGFVRPLADRLLRHETIEWAARWADATGRKLHLYGNGWDQHPRFGRYARGFVRHGVELGRAFRAAKINLHAAINTALHQRVLDGLAAGGFFLLRWHAADASHDVSRAIWSLTRERGLRPGATIRPADLPPPLDAELRRLWQGSGMDPDGPVELTDDHFAEFAKIHERGDVRLASGLWADYPRVSFASADALAERLDWFVAQEQDRLEIAARMREQILGAFGYQTLMRRLLNWLKERLATGVGAPARTRRDEVM